ncbi:uncharacterized protein UBRO2_06013 [Ustilago bromivora]|uniref:Uncharacterized protein n=1 Tax=Ustilago bromivora TaxID=307758 RepID=A0A8H8TTQ1_9BASI|nr:uncharacterized protein UBRO2_06013 [Ustilago bromivora]
MSAPVFARKAPTPSTPISDNNSDSTGSLFWDYLPKFLPDWMNQDIASRLPSSPNNGTYRAARQ